MTTSDRGSGGEDTLADQIRAAESRRKSVTVYAPAEDAGLEAALAVRNVDVEHRRLPDVGPSGFLVVREDGEFVGAAGVEAFARLLSSPHPPGADRDPGLSAMFEALEDLVFASLDRRQLLAAAREIEDRALRVGEGTLRVGFQTVSAFREQVELYRYLGTATDLDVHVYARPDWPPVAVPGVTFHAERTREIGRFWFMAFDGGGQGQECALVAEERSPGEFYGFWTYDPETVGEILAYLGARYG